MHFKPKTILRSALLIVSAIAATAAYSDARTDCVHNSLDQYDQEMDDAHQVHQNHLANLNSRWMGFNLLCNLPSYSSLRGPSTLAMLGLSAYIQLRENECSNILGSRLSDVIAKANADYAVILDSISQQNQWRLTSCYSIPVEPYQSTSPSPDMTQAQWSEIENTLFDAERVGSAPIAPSEEEGFIDLSGCRFPCTIVNGESHFKSQ